MSEIRKLNDNWLFHYGDEPDADYMGFDDRAWERVTLPHDWAVRFPFDKKHASGTGYLPGGRGRYRRHFVLTKEDLTKTVRVRFGGVCRHARVWINSNYLGQWAYAYTTFDFDLTPFVREGENVLSVAVEHDEVADSRWYTGSGIYRDVDLIFRHPDGFLPDSTPVRTLAADEREATVEIDCKTADADAVNATLLSPDGKTAAVGQASGKAGTLCLTVQNPALWSPESPTLYTLRLTAEKDGRAIDTETIPVGLRVCRFDPDAGFFLNGKNLKLKGVCLHHDGGCLGAAVPPEAWERRLKKLKAAGVNAVRTAHNPADESFITVCDRLGLMVMEEAFDEWEGPKNKWWQGHNVYPPKRFGYAFDFPVWHEKDLTSMVTRDRNHPSVILWSIGNEIDYPNDPYVTPLFRTALGNNDAGKPEEERRYDDKKPDAKRLPVIARELTETVHRLDPTRPVLTALSFPELSNQTGLSDVTDIAGYNYRERMYDDDHVSYPRRVILGSENGHDPAMWRAVEERPFIAGQFLWTGSDFLGECRGWPERASGAGLLDLAGNEKPLYYRRKALWTDAPFVKLACCPGGDRGVWADAFLYQGTEGEEISVSVYTNEKEAELFLNGASLGKKKCRKDDGGRLTWTFPYVPGTLTARTPHAADTLSTPGKAEKIALTRYAACVTEGDTVIFDVTLFDRDGNVAAADDRTLDYAFVGDGEILGIENGRRDDLTSYRETARATWRGRAVVYLRGRGGGRLCVFEKGGRLFAEAEIGMEE